MELDCCSIVWLLLIAGVLSQGIQLRTEKYQTSLDDSNSSYPIKVQTPVQTICSQECLQRNCTRFSYDSRTKECLLDDGTGEGLFNRSQGSQAYRYVLTPVSRILSRGKQVTASRVLSDYSASNIVDGYYTPEQSGLSEFDSLMALALQQDPWFEIDLEDNFCIEGMKFWRKPDRYVKDLELTVAKDGQHGNYSLCATRNGLLDFVEKVECTSPVIGRYMKVVQQANDRRITLYEVEVYGH